MTKPASTNRKSAISILNSRRSSVFVPGFVPGSLLRASPAVSFSFFFIFLLASFWLTGCQTGNISNVNQSYIAVRKAVMSNLPLGVRKESENGRTLYSGFFDPKKIDEDATDGADRAYAVVVILNDSRPYEVDAHVFRQKRTKRATYTNEGEDEKLTKNLVLRLRDALADRHEDRNIIDDFRAF